MTVVNAFDPDDSGKACLQAEINGQNDEEVLTGTVTSGTCGGQLERASMADDPRIEKIVSLIRELIADERQNTIDAIMHGVQTGGFRSNSEGKTAKRVTTHPDAEKSTRAPAGSGRVLCRRALDEAAEQGLTVIGIYDKRRGAFEQILSVSAVRNELSVGANLPTPLYKKVGGVWYLAEYAPSGMRIVS